MGVDVEGCKRVIRAAQKASPSQCITIGLQNRYGPGYLKAEKLLRENAIGSIKMARSNWIASKFSRPPYWFGTHSPCLRE